MWNTGLIVYAQQAAVTEREPYAIKAPCMIYFISSHRKVLVWCHTRVSMIPTAHTDHANTRTPIPACSVHIHCCTEEQGWRVAQRWWTLAARAEDPGSVHSTHMVLPTVYNYSSRGSTVLFWHLWAAGTHVAHRHTCRRNTHTDFFKN